MVPGLNSNVERNGAVFHVQTEDLGRSKPIIQTLVYYGGEVVTVLEYCYEELATSDEYSNEQVRRRLNRQHHRLLGEIAAGVFDAVDPGSGAPTFDEQFRERQRVLDYLESALAFGSQPCSASGTEPEGDAPAPEPAAAAKPIAAEEVKALEEPAPDRQGIPTEERTGTRRRLVIRRDQKESPQADESSDAEKPRVIRVRPCDETPQVVTVRQKVEVKVVGVEGRVDEVIDRLDRELERVVPVARPSRTVRWLAISAALVVLASVAAGWLWLSGQPAVEPLGSASEMDPELTSPVRQPRASPGPTQSRTPPEIEVTPAPPVVSTRVDSSPELPKPTERTTERSSEVTPSRIVATDRHGATPAVVGPPEEAATEVAEVEAPTASVAGAEAAGPGEGNEKAAKLTPAVPAITSAPPVEELDPEREAAEPPVPPPGEPERPAPQVRPGMLVELASVDAAPQPTAREFPEYPKRARKKGRQGRVALSLLIDEKGNVADVRLADGVAESDLSDAALDAVRRWKYTPARKGRHAVRVWKPVTVHFFLDDHNSSRVRVEE